MRILKNSFIASAASLLLFGGMAMAQYGSPPANDNTKSTTNGGVATADRHFIDKAAQGGMAEVELGQLAEQNGSSQQVKDFGKRMVTDHSKANDELKQLASQKGVSLPTKLDAKDQATKDRLSKLQGDAFDKAYMKDMVTDHKKDVAEFKHESRSAHDPDVKAWAGKTLPTLENHLQMAEQIAPTNTTGKAMNDNTRSKGMDNTTAQEPR